MTKFVLFLVASLAITPTFAEEGIEGQDQEVLTNELGRKHAIVLEDETPVGIEKGTAKIEFKKTGRYFVAQGFHKDGTMHVGKFIGASYYAGKYVDVEAGEVLEIEFPAYRIPPLNRRWKTAVFRKREDIKTKG